MLVLVCEGVSFEFINGSSSSNIMLMTNNLLSSVVLLLSCSIKKIKNSFVICRSKKNYMN
jgi:hypothetical protein